MRWLSEGRCKFARVGIVLRGSGPPHPHPYPLKLWSVFGLVLGAKRLNDEWLAELLIGCLPGQTGRLIGWLISCLLVVRTDCTWCKATERLLVDWLIDCLANWLIK